MFITGLGTAVPPQRYAQGAGWEAFLQSTLAHQLQPRSRAILKKVLNGSSGIATRHLALENLGQAFELTPDVLQARFTRNAPLLATQAAGEYEATGLHGLADAAHAVAGAVLVAH